MNPGTWLKNSIQTLIEHNHRLADIQHYTLDQFTICLEAAERAVAVSRVSFLVDMSTVVGGLFGGGKALKEHLDSLTEIIDGE